MGPGSFVDDLPYVITRELPIAALPRWLTTKLSGRGRADVTTAAVPS